MSSATTLNSNHHNAAHDSNVPIYGALPTDIAQVTSRRLPVSTRSRLEGLNFEHVRDAASSTTAPNNNMYNTHLDDSHLDPNLPTSSATSNHHHSSEPQIAPPHPPNQGEFDMNAHFSQQHHHSADHSIPHSQSPPTSRNDFEMLHPVVATHPSFYAPPPSPPQGPLVPHPQLPPPPPPIEPNTTGEYDMLPPPESLHPSFTELHRYAQEYAAEHGYALSINTTAKNRSRIKLACVCYGAPKNTHKLTAETRVRKNRQSSKTGCKMWIEGKKQEDGSWVLRVGEANHNHEGRAVEGWAVQRKRTWGVQGGRIGLGGVTAREEKERLEREGRVPDEDFQRAINSHVQSQPPTMSNGAEAEAAKQDETQSPPSHSLENGGMVWRIVEQEMLKKGGQGRDRGVGRTVKVLQEKLPGIRIFKRDVYNIRAQIKRARKQAGQVVGETLLEEGDTQMLVDPPEGRGHENNRFHPEIDPLLVAQCNDALRNVSAQQQQQGGEVERLKREVQSLRRELEQRNKRVEEVESENVRLKNELEIARFGPGYV